MRLRDGLESKLRYNQNGILHDRSTLQDALALGRHFEIAKTKKNFVNAIMALYNGAAAEVVTSNGTFDEIKSSVGVLQSDTLASYLFDIVIDYVLRNAIENQTLGITLHRVSDL
jgi:hypothetical protein